MFSRRNQRNSVALVREGVFAVAPPWHTSAPAAALHCYFRSHNIREAFAWGLKCREQKMKLLHQRFGKEKRLEALSWSRNTLTRHEHCSADPADPCSSLPHLSSPDPAGTDSSQLLIFISAAFPCALC